MIYNITESIKDQVLIPNSYNVRVSKDNLAIIRFEIMKDFLENNLQTYSIFVPAPVTLRVWDGREKEYTLINANDEYLEERVSNLARAMYSVDGCIDEWNKSLLTLSIILDSTSSKLYVHEDYKALVYQHYIFKENIFFYDDVTKVLHF